jgi:hypothetical protein
MPTRFCAPARHFHLLRQKQNKKNDCWARCARAHCRSAARTHRRSKKETLTFISLDTRPVSARTAFDWLQRAAKQKNPNKGQL